MNIEVLYSQKTFVPQKQISGYAPEGRGKRTDQEKGKRHEGWEQRREKDKGRRKGPEGRRGNRGGQRAGWGEVMEGRRNVRGGKRMEWREDRGQKGEPKGKYT